MEKKFVEIKLSAINDKSVSPFLRENNFYAATPYEVFGMTGGKIILVNKKGDLLEIFPRFLRVIKP